MFPAADGTISVLPDRGGIAPDRSIPVADTLQPGERVTSVLPDWQGRYWYVGNRGTVGVVRAEGGPAQGAATGRRHHRELVRRDPRRGVCRHGFGVVPAGRRPRSGPQVRWRTTYDAGTRQKPGQTSRATGTTRQSSPTAATWRSPTTTIHAESGGGRHRRRLGDVCSGEVFTADRSATENSLIAVGDLLVVENNYGYAPPITATSAGNTSVGGLAAIDVDPARAGAESSGRTTTSSSPRWSPRQPPQGTSCSRTRSRRTLGRRCLVLHRRPAGYGRDRVDPVGRHGNTLQQPLRGRVLVAVGGFPGGHRQLGLVVLRDR